MTLTGTVSCVAPLISIFSATLTSTCQSLELWRKNSTLIKWLIISWNQVFNVAFIYLSYGTSPHTEIAIDDCSSEQVSPFGFFLLALPATVVWIIVTSGHAHFWKMTHWAGSQPSVVGELSILSQLLPPPPLPPPLPPHLCWAGFPEKINHDLIFEVPEIKMNNFSVQNDVPV